MSVFHTDRGEGYHTPTLLSDTQMILLGVLVGNGVLVIYKNGAYLLQTSPKSIKEHKKTTIYLRKLNSLNLNVALPNLT